MPNHVLYAEDDENDAFFMQRTFEKLPAFALQIVPDGLAAIAYLEGGEGYADRQAHPLPELLLLDIKMPQATGLEVLAWVRQQPQFAGLPVVMLTSSTQLKDIEASRTFGANAYLVKPSQAKDLNELMQKLIAALKLTAGAPSGPLAMPGNLLIAPAR